MAINNIGQMSEVLKNYNAGDWVKSADLSHGKQFSISDAPELNSVTHETNRSFSDLLADSIKSVNSLQKDANLAIERLATGKSKNLHETMLAVERADIAFRTMNQIRMKVIDAYKEIMRMQV